MSVAVNNGTTGRQVCFVPMDEVMPNQRQPRQEFDEHSLMELAASIKRFGLLQPVTVRPTNGHYELIMGERRFRACRILGYTQIDAFILPVNTSQSAMLALIENIQRENLHFFDEAEAYASILREGQVTQEVLARQLGKSPGCVANKLRLLKLDDETRQYIFEAGLTERHARALLRLPDASSRLRIARLAGEQALSVQKTEALVDKALSRLPVVSPIRGKTIACMRDHRLYVNAIKNIVKQLQDAGVAAEMNVCEGEMCVEMRIILPKARGIEKARGL